MSFQIKDFLSITLGQINHAKSATDRITDFAPGSVARTLMEAPAVEIEQLYLQMFLGLRDAIPEATFLSFGFTKRPAALAQGYVSASAVDDLPDDITIPLGTSFTAIDGRVYKSTQAVVWHVGVDIIQIPVAYSEAGLAGNIAAGQITASSFLDSLKYTINNSAITNGLDLESDTEREARFREYIRSLSRGTVVACTFAASSAQILDGSGNITEYVTRVGLSETPGYVRIYLYSSLGVASTQLLAVAQATLDGSINADTGAITEGVRSAGVQVDALAMVERAVPGEFAVDMLSGYTLTTGVQQALGDIYASQIRAVPAGAVLYLGALVEAMLAVPGVQQIVPASDSNIVCGINEALTPGTLVFVAL